MKEGAKHWLWSVTAVALYRFPRFLPDHCAQRKRPRRVCRLAENTYFNLIDDLATGRLILPHLARLAGDH